MSVAELGIMVNSNFRKPLNEQMREMKYLGAYLITASKTFVPDKTGYYKIIAVGRGGETYYSSSRTRYGGAGGVAIATRLLESGKSYEITMSGTSPAGQTENTSYYSSFQHSSENIIIGYNGNSANSSYNGAPGKASGGDLNYTGNYGDEHGADVGVFIPELMRKTTVLGADADGNTQTVTNGLGILEYGGGQGIYGAFSPPLKGGCVLIIPLELNE